MRKKTCVVVLLWVCAIPATFAQNAASITSHIKRADIEAVTGVSLKEPTFTEVDFSRGVIAKYYAVKPRPYDAEVCTISTGVLDEVMYASELKVDKGMGYKGELAGLGDKAYWADLGQDIGAYTKVAVRKGKRYVSVILTDSKPGLARLEAAKQLVNKMLPYL